MVLFHQTFELFGEMQELFLQLEVNLIDLFKYK